MDRVFPVTRSGERGTIADIQRAVDAAAAGGGTVLVPAGMWWLGDSVHLKSGVTLMGEAGTVLKKVPSISQPITQHLGYGHFEFSVAEPDAFAVGMGVHITDDFAAGGFLETVATIVDRDGDTFFIDRPLRYDYYLKCNARVSSIFPLVSILNANDVAVENLVLDGNDAETRFLGGCRGGGIYALRGQRLRFEKVEIQHYNGDGVSFQQSVDVLVRGCRIHHNAGLGLHPGSGSVRYLMEDNHLRDNGRDGLFYCLRTTHSLCRRNVIENNGGHGISIGERDTDHEIRENVIRGNAQSGVLFRADHTMGARRVLLEANRIEGNGGASGAPQIRISANLRDLHVVRNIIAAGAAVEVGEGVEGVVVAANVVGGEPQRPEQIEGAGATRVIQSAMSPSWSVGPAALDTAGARHLRIDALGSFPWSREIGE